MVGLLKGGRRWADVLGLGDNRLNYHGLWAGARAGVGCGFRNKRHKAEIAFEANPDNLRVECTKLFKASELQMQLFTSML